MCVKLLKKRILYKSMYRGTRESDFLIKNFVTKNIDNYNTEEELEKLESFLEISDSIIFEILREKKCEIYQKYKDIFDILE